MCKISQKESTIKEIISSRQNSRIQRVSQLLTSTAAITKENAFVAEGIRLVEEGVNSNTPLEFVLYTENLSERGLELMERLAERTECFLVDSKLLNQVSNTRTSQGILAVFKLAPLPLPEKPDFLVIIDQLRDPGNLGTLLRTAEAAGVQGMLLSPGTTQAFAPKVVRAGMGAHFRLPIHACSWQQIQDICAGMHIFIADMQGTTSIWQADFTKATAILIGGEATGPSEAARNLDYRSVHIPMPGPSESLNASLAGAILMFEVVRQRQK